MNANPDRRITLNLTPYPTTLTQSAYGVVDLPNPAREKLCTLLRFSGEPSERLLNKKARQIADLVASERSFARRNFQSLLTTGELLAKDGYPDLDPEQMVIRILAVANALRALIGTIGMIGDAIWLMAPLAAALREQGIEPMFACVTRKREVEKQPDGSVRSITVFHHADFIPAFPDKEKGM